MVMWVQGCTLGCPGCFNPHTHPAVGGEILPVATLFARICALQKTIEGITVSGGEPLQQFRPLLALLRRVRVETELTILVFSGYSWQEIQRMPQAKELFNNIDVLIAGRFVAQQRYGRGLIGSANQTVHFLTRRYNLADLNAVPAAETIITLGGKITSSGIDPLVQNK